VVHCRSSGTARKIGLILLGCSRAIVDEADPVHRQLRLVCIGVEDLPADVVVYLSNNHLECRLHVGGVQRRRFHEKQSFRFCKAFPFLNAHRPYILQIAFVPHQHHGHRRITMSCIHEKTQLFICSLSISISVHVCIYLSK